MNFQPHRLYRLAYTMADRELAGKPVVFFEMRQFTIGDIIRCRVRLLERDGTLGNEHLVAALCLIPF